MVWFGVNALFELLRVALLRLWLPCCVVCRVAICRCAFRVVVCVGLLRVGLFGYVIVECVVWL